jgi:hypothetical protein
VKREADAEVDDDVEVEEQDRVSEKGSLVRKKAHQN